MTRDELRTAGVPESVIPAIQRMNGRDIEHAKAKKVEYDNLRAAIERMTALLSTEYKVELLLTANRLYSDMMQGGGQKEAAKEPDEEG